MYNLNETICAISSADVIAQQVSKSILRISGSNVRQLVAELIQLDREIAERGLYTGTISIGDFLRIEAEVYFFAGPASYTGEDIAEVHFFAAAAAVEEIFARLLTNCRMAGPGEFTLRAYLNGKLDLSQAEAVAQIVAGGSLSQVDAAQRLLAGRLCETVTGLRDQIIDVLSLLEAGMDFSEEEIEFISRDNASHRISKVCSELDGLLNESIRYEETISLPSVGLVGPPNAGKSSLLNRLLGSERSIISDQVGTTRDVLTGILELNGLRCLAFDCAGLEETAPHSVIDDWAQTAAKEAIRGADMLAVCVDLTAAEYAGIGVSSDLIEGKHVLLVGTKADMLTEEKRAEKLTILQREFKVDAVACSSLTGEGIDRLCEQIRMILAADESAEREDMVSINERHRLTVQKAVKALADAADEIASGKDEVCAMLLREAYEVLGGIEREDVDEGVLDRIFGKFCIGK